VRDIYHAYTSRTFDLVTAARTRAVTSMVVSRLSVLTESFSWCTLTRDHPFAGGPHAATILRRMPTWGEARTAATARLRTAPDADTAGLDADVLLSHVLGVGKEALFAHPERRLTAVEEERFQELVDRRTHGEPVAYLRGSRSSTAFVSRWIGEF